MFRKSIILFSLCLFALSIFPANASNAEKSRLTVQKYNQKAKSYSAKIRNCTPYKDRSFQIYGMSGGKCHYARSFYEYNGKSHPLTDCYAPMSVMRQCADNLVNGLSDDSISIDYNSSTDSLQKYCKNINTTIKIK